METAEKISKTGGSLGKTYEILGRVFDTRNYIILGKEQSVFIAREQDMQDQQQDKQENLLYSNAVLRS